jgi:hypothetical protein
MKKHSKLKQTFYMQKIRLFITVLIFTLFLSSWIPDSENGSIPSGDNPESISQAKMQYSSLDSIVNFLLDASAKDFNDHQPPIPVNFRNVIVRNLLGQNGENHYMICGEFLEKEKQSKDEWTTFVTIKTSGYEQWIGRQAIGFCQDAKEISYKISDLSSALKSRVDSLIKK